MRLSNFLTSHRMLTIQYNTIQYNTIQYYKLLLITRKLINCSETRCSRRWKISSQVPPHGVIHIGLTCIAVRGGPSNSRDRHRDSQTNRQTYTQVDRNTLQCAGYYEVKKKTTELLVYFMHHSHIKQSSHVSGRSIRCSIMGMLEGSLFSDSWGSYIKRSFAISFSLCVRGRASIGCTIRYNSWFSLQHFTFSVALHKLLLSIVVIIWLQPWAEVCSLLSF